MEKTVINTSINYDSFATELNTGLSSETIALVGKLDDKYEIIEKMDVQSGEADLYICEYQNKRYVAKVYRRERAIKKEILDIIKTIKSPYVANCFDTGIVNGCTYEIIPYYANGSLQNKTVSYEVLRDSYIPALNEGLHLLHQREIIHKDLKPSNIMLNDDGKSVAIIDFGISSVLNDGQTLIVTNTGMTPIYSAPETHKGLFLKISDYYSLGITLYELFTGHLPFAGMTAKEIEQLESISGIPFPDEMPVDLKELILGLTYRDIQNRNNLNNPNRRWGYEEVNKWLQGIKQVIPGEGVASNNLIPYLFNNQEYADITELVQALANHWEDGKKHLFRGLLTHHFAKFDPVFEEVCKKAEQKAANNEGKDDIVFFEMLYGLDKISKKFFWKGKTYLNLPSLGRDIISELPNKKSDMEKFMTDVVENHVISRFCSICDSENIDRYDAIKKLEDFYSSEKDKQQKLVQLYVIGYTLSGQSTLKVNDKAFNTIKELSDYLIEISKDAVNSFKIFKSISKELLENERLLKPQFEAWLIVNKGIKELGIWRRI